MSFVDARTTVRTAGGDKVILEDYAGDRPLWSSALIGSAQAVDATLFRYAKGEKVAGANNSAVDADERHTNNDYAGQMPDSDDMLVYSIAMEFDNDIPWAAIQSITDDMYCEFYAGGVKPLYDGLAKHFPGGSGLGGMSNENARFAFTNGEPKLENIRKMAVPLHIGPNKKFKFVLSTPGGALAFGTADTLARVIFRGYRKLSVQ